MTAFGVDEAWARLTPAQLKAAGKTFAIGYVSENSTGKNITAAEVQALHAAGLGVLLVYEYSITAAESGTAGGRANATLAVAQSRARGYPAGCAIAFAIDEASPNLAALDGYSRAFTGICRDAGYRSMVYGGYATVRYCLDHRVVDLGWQTYAWSGGRWDPRAVIRQVRNGVTIAGKDVDLDTAMTADFGAWMPDNQGDDMALTDAQAAALQELTSIRNPDVAGQIIGEHVAWGLVFGKLDDLADRLRVLADEVTALQAAVSALAAPALSGDLAVTGTLHVAPTA